MNYSYYRFLLMMQLFVMPFDMMAQTTDEQFKKYLAAAESAETETAYMAAMNSADSFAKKTNNVAGQAMVNRDIGSHYYNTDADECIKYLQKAHRLYATAGDKKEAALSLNNIAFTYHEKKKDLPNSMKYTRMAINAHTERNDTPGMANMYKFQAMLYGKMHDYKNGKKSGAKAIQLFASKNQLMGVAVSYRDLAIVYEEERLYDSAIGWMLRAKEIWSKPEYKEKNWSRIHGINADLIRMYARADRPEEAVAVIEENEANQTGLHFYDKLKFYKEGKDFYQKRDKERAVVYREKYSGLRDSLKEAGLNVE